MCSWEEQQPRDKDRVGRSPRTRPETWGYQALRVPNIGGTGEVLKAAMKEELNHILVHINCMVPRKT